MNKQQLQSLEYDECVTLVEYLDLRQRMGTVCLYTHIKDIKGYEGVYKITDGGDIISLKKKWKRNYRILKHNTDNYGYSTVTLSNHNIRKTFTVHRLVAVHFIKNHNKYTQINHKDGNKKNNAYLNLEWCTNSMNTSHAYRNGLMRADGENNGQHKLTKNQVLEIRNSSISAKELAGNYKVSSSTIFSIRNRSRWKTI